MEKIFTTAGKIDLNNRIFRLKKTCYFIFLLLAAFSAQAQTVVTIKGATSGSSTLFLKSGTNLYVEGGINIDQNGSAAIDSNDYLQNNGTIELAAGVGLSNFTNNVTGLKVYSTGQTTGQLLFAANSQTQTISGSGTVEFMNLTVNNTLSPKVNLSQNVIVDGILNIGGIINLQSNNLALSSSGSLAGSPFSSANMLQADGTGQFISVISANTPT
jgi:hypothetical protein